MHKKAKITIWVNMMVKNEERWIWYSLKSILSCVDKIFVWDTGSSDNTVKIVNSIKNKKIKFQQIGRVNKSTFSKLRQKMLDQTKSDWVFNVAGDEVWPKRTLLELVSKVKKAPKYIDTFCVRPLNFVGDIRFIHPETFYGQTPLAPKGINGFFSSRIFKRNILGLHISGKYGSEGFFDSKGLSLRERKKHVKYLTNIYYWHMTYLPRSVSKNKDNEVMMRKKKRKYEIGIKKPKWVEVPEVFYLNRPKFVPDPFYKMNSWEYTRALIQTPLKKIKRRVFSNQ
ncbi:glycosyltransferase [Patescibacteria group bacterium]